MMQVLGFLGGGLSSQTQFTAGRFAVDNVFNLLENLGIARSLSSPSLTVLSGEIASFQVGGGTLLLISALQMLNAQPAESKPSDALEGREKAEAGASVAVVPLTIPLLTGPATISTMGIYAERTRHWWEQALLVGYGLVVAAVTFAVFTLSDRIAQFIGRTGINVMTRLMGLILAALAVEIMAEGLSQLFPVLQTRLPR